MFVYPINAGQNIAVVVSSNFPMAFTNRPCAIAFGNLGSQTTGRVLSGGGWETLTSMHIWFWNPWESIRDVAFMVLIIGY